MSAFIEKGGRGSPNKSGKRSNLEEVGEGNSPYGVNRDPIYEPRCRSGDETHDGEMRPIKVIFVFVSLTNPNGF